ncbi:hypothetical protein B0H16DRAFT_1446458 [Mycena metata]|uniref:Uncharacterized protein n=1 Tax=Mycena metata TaxID=1033252 RepID=A0AAD7P1T0_9AGAR|nr:hypothetical protein B0H16DRAFT_1446458 [Mycena metata]
MGRRSEKRARRRVPKAERRNLRLWAEGARESILTPHLEGYAQALDAGWQDERKYWKFDPNVHIPSVVLPPDQEIAMQTKKKEINERIRRWLSYRVRKFRRHRAGANLDPTKDPFAVLLAKLSGVTAPPKARQAFQQFMHESYTEQIAPVVADQWAAKRADDPGNPDFTKAPKAGFRAQVARELFGDLSAAEQQAIAARAKEAAASKRSEYQTAMKARPSQAPADRQKCIDALPDFAGPILRGIQEYTGLHAVLVFGGPMPKYSGELKTLHVAYGRNHSANACSWPQWNKKRFGEQVIDFMTEYLGTAFTPQECAAASLTPLASLAGAKYTIDSIAAKAATKASGNSDSDSDSDSSSSSESGSDESGSDSESEADEPPARKKRKVLAADKGKGRAAPAPPAASSLALSSDAPIWRNQQGMTWDQQREFNRTQNAALLARVTEQFQIERPDLAKPTAKRTRTGARTQTGPITPGTSVRTSRRLANKDDDNGTTESSSSVTQGPSAPSPASYVSSTARDTPPPPPSTAPLPVTTIPAPTPTVLPPPASAPPAAATASTVPTPTTPCPTNAAAWFVDAHAQMTKKSLGPHFDAVVAAWTRVEAASKYAQGPTNLTKKNRPQQVTNWIARGRKGGDTAVTDPAAYAAGWQLWWDLLQPEWRAKDDDGAWLTSSVYGPDDGEAWGHLFQWGTNGTLSIVASLYFWGLGVRNDAVHHAVWEKAVLDVGWMLEGLAIFYEKFSRKF